MGNNSSEGETHRWSLEYEYVWNLEGSGGMFLLYIVMIVLCLTYLLYSCFHTVTLLISA